MWQMLAKSCRYHHTGHMVVDERITLPLRWPRRCFLALLLPLGLGGALVMGMATMGCSKTEAGADAGALPPLHLSDDAPEVVLTWVDAQGGAHTAMKIADVPAESRTAVRVVTKDAGHGQLFYVADLSHQRDDGSYPITTMSRRAWEARLAKLRQQAMAAHTPPAPHTPGAPPATAPGAAPPAGAARHAQPATGVHASVYGASWCKPCHQAAAYLERQGVTVTVYDIEKSPSKQREMQAKLRRAGRSGGSIPVIDIEGTMLVGFSTRAIDNAIRRARAAHQL